MNKEVNEAIVELEENIANENKLIELLKQFEQLAEAGLSEADYHTFCETDMRNTDSLGKALLKVFPFLTYEKREPNCFRFRIQEESYIIEIPSSCATYVGIVVDTYYQDKKVFIMDEVSENRRKREIAQKEAFLSTRSVFKRSRIIYPYVHPIASLFAYVFSSIGKNRSQEISDELVRLYKKQKDVADKESEWVRQNQLNREAQQAVFSRYIPLFLKWTDEVYVFEKGWKDARETHERTDKRKGE